MSDSGMGRRRLLGAVVAAGAALSLPGQIRAATPRRGKFGIAVVGLGNYARFCMQRLMQSRHARPAALVTASPDRAREWAREFDIERDAIYGYDDYARLAADERVQAVHICLPVGLHAEHARRAFAAGKHVLCEKPLAASSSEVAELRQMAATSGLQLMPAYRAWFSDAVQQLIASCRQRTYGDLCAIDAHKGFAMALPAGNWRFDPALAGAGCLYDIGIYSLQLQRWIAGGLPVQVTAMVQKGGVDARFARVESEVHWVAEFAGGVHATGSASWRYRLQNRVRAACTQAWLDLDPATPAIGERLRIGLDGPNRIEEPQLALNDQVPRMYDAFAQACLGHSALPIDAADAQADLQFAEAVLKSASLGSRVALASPR